MKNRIYVIKASRSNRWVFQMGDGDWDLADVQANDITHPVCSFSEGSEITTSPQQASGWARQASNHLGVKCEIVRIDLAVGG